MIKNIKLFYSTFDTFLDFLNTQFKFCRGDLILLKNSISISKNINPKIFIDEYMKIMIPYHKNIKECNDDFIMKGDFDNDILLKVRNIWISGKISTRQKAYIWYYLTKLFNLGFAIIASS